MILKLNMMKTKEISKMCKLPFKNEKLLWLYGQSIVKIFIVGVMMLLCVQESYAQQSSDVDRFGKNYEDRVTSGGLVLSAESNAFIIHGFKGYTTTPCIGGSLGGFIDFKIVPKFVIQMNLMVNYNQFLMQNPAFVEHSHFSSWGLEIPLYFMYRLKLKNDNGIFYFGAGPYTEFVFDCHLKTGNEITNPYTQVVSSTQDGHDFFALSDNNSGVKLKLCYEMKCRVQFSATVGMSISDILGYPHSSKETFVRPYKATIGIAYRFR